MREAFFHEDNYKEIEILPLDNAHFCLQQIQEICENAEGSGGEFGYSEMHVREKNPSTTANLNILLADIRNVVTNELPEYDAVTTGYGSSYTEKCNNVYAFGKNFRTTTLFVELSKEQIVKSLWCTSYIPIFQKLPHENKLLFVDWNWCFVSPLQNTKKLEEYQEEKRAYWQKVNAEIRSERKKTNS